MDNNLIQSTPGGVLNGKQEIVPDNSTTLPSVPISTFTDNNKIQEGVVAINSTQNEIPVADHSIDESLNIIPNDSEFRANKVRRVFKVLISIAFIILLVGNAILIYMILDKDKEYKNQQAIITSQKEEYKKQQLAIDNKSNCPVSAPVAAEVETPNTVVSTPTIAPVTKPAATSKKTTTTLSSSVQEDIIAPPPPPSD